MNHEEARQAFAEDLTENSEDGKWLMPIKETINGDILRVEIALFTDKPIHYEANVASLRVGDFLDLNIYDRRFVAEIVVLLSAPNAREIIGEHVRGLLRVFPLK